jgi:hypothetical protein
MARSTSTTLIVARGSFALWRELEFMFLLSSARIFSADSRLSFGLDLLNDLLPR